MHSRRRQFWIFTGILFSGIAALLVVGIGGFGIWDPWELNAADAARDLLDGELEQTAPPLSRWLIALGFSSFGVSEWSGRLPIALGGLLVLGAAFWGGRKFSSDRTALYAALIAGSSPLFLFNARQMLGTAWGMGATGLLGVIAASAALLPCTSEDASVRMRHAVLHVAGLAGAFALALLAAGGLSGAAPPLLAVAGVLLLRQRIPTDRAQQVRALAVVGLAVVTAVLVGFAISTDAAEYSMWLGGSPRGGDPPTFEAALEVVFHSFAPWSALVLIACARMLAPASAEAPTETADATDVDEDADADEDDAEDEALGGLALSEAFADFRLVLVLWAAFGYAALNLYTARYGPTTYLAIVPLALAVALFLRDIEQSKRAWWPEAVISMLFVGLLIRDFALYPESPVRGLPISGLTVPEIFDAKAGWAGVLGLFGLALLVGMGVRPKGARPDFRAPYRWLRDRYRRDMAGRIWIGLGATLAAAMLIFGAVCWIGGDALPFTSIVTRVGKKIALVPIVIPILVAAVPWGSALANLIGHWRMVPLLGAGAVFAVYAAHGYLPELSQHFSPREVYDSYNELAGEGEPLAEYGVGGRAAAYYADGETTDLDTQPQLQEWLAREERVWAVVPADDLAAINRTFRQAHQRHLYVADARSARVLLVTNQNIAGRENQNFIAGAVLDEAPRIQHRVGGRFDDKIELIGYDLDLPNEGYVGAGQAFTVTWYWRALTRVGGSYKIFLHVDGHGNRLNGDHDPVDERYPVRLWDEGDIVVDRQTLRVPANYRPGPYTFWIGFFSGNSRLSVHPEERDDGAQRMNAGTVMVR